MEHSSGSEGTAGASYFLGCPYCNWSSLDIGVEFAKHTGITAQLAKLKNARQRRPPKSQEEQAEDADSTELDLPDVPPTPDDRFAALKTFYKDALSASAQANPLGFDPTLYNSPPSIARIVNLYADPRAKRAKATKPKPMREAATPSAGLHPLSPTAEDAAIAAMAQCGWDSLASTAQRASQPHPTKFVEELWPTPTRLLTRRAKRCATCRHILTKPDAKISSTRYRIRILALDKIPALSIRALAAAHTPHPSFPLTISSAAAAAPPFEYDKLQPGRTQQYVLTLRNPLFEPVRVTLGTPAIAPGKLGTRVTILCPQFEVGANTDVWDEALSAAGRGRESTPGLPEAGKVWEKGRNWVSVVVEVVPGFPKGGIFQKEEEDMDEEDTTIEVPVFVRFEWEVEHPDAAVFEKMREGGQKVPDVDTGRQTREVAFWTVLGVGRVVGG